MINKGEKLPCSITKEFVTIADNQKVVDLGEIEILPDIMSKFDPTVKDQNPYEEYIKKVSKLAPKAKIFTDKNLFNYMFNKY